MDNSLAYLAGFIDGEGSISIGINNGNNGRKRYYLRMSAHQVDRRPLQMLLDSFGGSIRMTERIGNQRAIYEWVVVSEVARLAIEKLRPHLVVKDKQADVGLLFQSTLNNRPVGRTVKLTPEELSQRHALYEEIRRLKWETTT